MENNKTLGSFLKAAREEKKLTLQQVASKTKININVLKDLENDEIAKLPNITYVKGFVKNYAKTVSADPTEAKLLLEQAYKVDQAVAETGTESVALKPEPQDEKTIGISPKEAEEIKANLISFIQGMFKKKYIVPLIALIIAIVIIKSILSWISTLVNEPGKLVTPTSEIQFSEEITAQNIQILPTPSNEPREIVVTPVKKIEVTISDPEEETKNVEPPTPTPTPSNLKPGELPFRTFSPAPLSTFSVVTDAPEAEDRRLLPPSIKASAEQGKQNVYIVAESGDTWLSYKVDDQPIKRYILKQERRLFLKGDRVLLFIGNYNVAKVFYNNKFVNAQTNTGVKSLIFPAEAAKELVLPLFPSYKGVPYEAKEYMERMKDKED